MQWIKAHWQFVLIGLLVLTVIGMGAVLSGKAPAPQVAAPAAPAPAAPATMLAAAPAQPALAPAPASTAAPVCPPQFENCTPKKTDAQLVAAAIDRLGGRMAAPPQAAPAPATAALAAEAPAPAGAARFATHVASKGGKAGRDPAVRYSGGTCRLSTGSVGLDGVLKSTGERRCFTF